MKAEDREECMRCKHLKPKNRLVQVGELWTCEDRQKCDERKRKEAK